MHVFVITRKSWWTFRFFCSGGGGKQEVSEQVARGLLQLKVDGGRESRSMGREGAGGGGEMSGGFFFVGAETPSKKCLKSQKDCKITLVHSHVELLWDS